MTLLRLLLTIALAAATGSATAQAAAPEDAPREALDSAWPVAGRYGVLTVADQIPGGTLSLHLIRTAAGYDAAITHRLIRPDGATVTAERSWETNISGQSSRAPLGEPGTWRLEVSGADASGFIVQELDMTGAARVVPPTARLEDEGTRDARVAWDPVPGASHYHVAVFPASAAPNWYEYGLRRGALLPADTTSWSLAAFPVSEHVVRVHAFSADPLGRGGAPIGRVDEAVSAPLTYVSQGPLAEPQMPSGDFEVHFDLTESRLLVAPPAVEEAAGWLVRVVPLVPTEDAITGVSAFMPRGQDFNVSVTLDVAGQMLPGVPYLLEVQAFGPVPEGAPGIIGELLAVGYAGPLYMEPAADADSVLVLRMGRYEDGFGTRLLYELAGREDLGELAVIRLYGPDGAELDARTLSPSAHSENRLAWSGPGTYRVVAERNGQAFEEFTLTVLDEEPLERPSGLNLSGAATDPASGRLVLPESESVLLRWDPVPGADYYEVEFYFQERSWYFVTTVTQAFALPFLLDERSENTFRAVVYAVRGAATADWESPVAAAVRHVSVSEPLVFDVARGR